MALGSFGAHALRGRLSPELLQVFETGHRQHMLHAVGLLAVAWASTRWPGGAARRPRAASGAAGALFVIGTVLFSGSLYLLAVTGQRGLGAITPFGGVAFLLGWLALAWAAWSGR